MKNLCGHIRCSILSQPVLIIGKVKRTHMPHVHLVVFISDTGYFLIQIPEMLRMPLTELCLQVKLLSLGPIKQFLSKASPFIVFL